MGSNDNVILQTGSEPLLDTALKLRDMALKDEYFIKRKLARLSLFFALDQAESILLANVDFFSGLIYRYDLTF